MIRAYSAFLALRYLTSRWINLLGACGVAVGVWALIVVIAVFSGLIADIRDNIRAASADVLVTGLPEEASFAEVERLLVPVDGIAAVAPRLEHYAIYYPHGLYRIQQTNRLITSALEFDYVRLIGVDATREGTVTGLRAWLTGEALGDQRVSDPARPFRVPPEVQARRSLQGPAEPPLRSLPGLLLGSRRTRQALDRGDRIDVLSARFDESTQPALLRKFRLSFALSGAFDSRSRSFDETTAIADIDVLREWMFDADPFGDWDRVNSVAIRGADGASLDALAARVAAALGGRFPGARAWTWEQQNAAYLGAVEQERGLMKLALFVVMLVAAFLIYATLNMMVTQKIRDIGVLSALGGAPRGIHDVFLLGGTIVALGGCAAGTLAGVLTAHNLDDILGWFGLALFPRDLYSIDHVPYRIELAWVLQVSLGAIAISLLAAWLPARRAARLEPVRALAHI